jgi:putative membrane protein
MRNGVMIAIAAQELPPFYMLLFAGIVASIAAYILTITLSRRAWIFSGLDTQKISFMVIVFVTALSVILCGPFGLLVLVLATCVGVVPDLVNVRRVACMGAIMVPIIVSSFHVTIV